MDRAPLVAIAGQDRPRDCTRKVTRFLDLVSMFKPITKYSTQVLTPDIVPEIVRKAFKVAQTEKPGCCFIDFPENIAEMEVKESRSTCNRRTTRRRPTRRSSKPRS